MIYTFYSFKGGVGRSMALANVAESFHEKGLRVLMVDWDLEAPGLEAFFRPAGPAAERDTATNAHAGLIDLLMKYRTAYPRIASVSPPLQVAIGPNESDSSEGVQASSVAEKLLQEREDLPPFLRKNPFVDAVPLTLTESIEGIYRSDGAPFLAQQDLPAPLADSPFRKYIQCIHPPGRDQQNGLYLISAGARGENQYAEYAVHVQEFDWAEFYAAYDGHAYFSWFRRKLSELADVVLIDSRTGVTEMGGVCTRHLPDVVVSFCAPNSQNLDGILRVASSVNRNEVKQARDDRHIEVMVIPARIDTTESDRLDRFAQEFARSMEVDVLVPEPFRDLERPLWNLKVPYIPRYTYGEERVLGADVSSPTVAQDLIDAYRRIAVHLAVLAPAGTRPRELYAAEIGTAFPHLVRTVPQMAPHPPVPWVERRSESEALKHLLRRARSSDGRGLRIGVFGGPGSGKTSLVAQVCRDAEVVSAFADGVLWVTADRPWTSDAAHAWWRSCFGFGRGVGQLALRELLGQRRLLVVVDDVWDRADIAGLLEYAGSATQIVISRDSSTATSFGDAALFVGALASDQSAWFLNTDFDPSTLLVGSQDSGFALAQSMTRWPLGATLLRTALQRRLTQQESLEQAWEALRQAFSRHQILAFDQPGDTDRATSAARSLRETMQRLTPEERSVLTKMAKHPSAEERRSEIEPALKRLSALGLVRSDASTGRPQIDPLVRSYLYAQGELEESLAVKPSKHRVSSSEDQKEGRNADVERAKSILRGESAALPEMQSLAERLKNSRYFGLARRVFARCRRHQEAIKGPESNRLELAQRHALCTYRDPDLPADERFVDALQILEHADLNASVPSQETLGLAGAVYKYRWKLTGRRSDLERSYVYYARGEAQGVERDFGYTGINAAFVLNLLAVRETEDAPESARRHLAEAERIRAAIAAKLPALQREPPNAWLKNEWWFYATLAEAFFGLERYDEARFWLREGLVLDVPDWQIESTTRQLAALAHARDPKMLRDSEAWRTLRLLVGDAGPALQAIALGKVGLALSGGGFRASLFHIGVLARLAELDLLRHVEVLSCVSGGSILGAHYYLELRRLLKEKGDRAITRDDYLEIVRRLETDFVEAVQQNLRTRLFAGWWTNVRTLVAPAYTRTNHLGRLFERHIYARVADGERGVRWLNELRIRPQGAPDFNPKLDNWHRAAKGPILLLNATTLNTGHNWQFAVSWMGEPPLGASSMVDRNDVLRRMYYWEAPPRHRRISLGEAVAASACVPGLFDPIELSGLFPGHTVRLVDGGVHDNQGIGGLLEQECTVLIVSDASGQADTEARPSGEPSSCINIDAHRQEMA